MWKKTYCPSWTANPRLIDVFGADFSQDDVEVPIPRLREDIPSTSTPYLTMDLCETARLVRSGGEESIRRIGVARMSQVLRQGVTRAMRFLRSPHPTRATIFGDTIDGGMTAEYVMLFLTTVLRDRTLSCFD